MTLFTLLSTFAFAQTVQPIHPDRTITPMWHVVDAKGAVQKTCAMLPKTESDKKLYEVCWPGITMPDTVTKRFSVLHKHQGRVK